MKTFDIAFQRRSFLDTIGLLALLTLFSANAFHFEIYNILLFYREQLAALFLALILCYMLTRSRPIGGYSWWRNRALFFLLLFPMLLALWSFIDPGVPIYGDDGIEKATEQLVRGGLILYVLRNALIYLPLVVYVYLRGLNLREIHLIAFVAILVAPLSIAAYLQSGDVARITMLGLVAEKGGLGIAYNTYAPYLTFSVLCGIFLLFSRINIFLKILVLISTSMTSIFCLLSSSRQAVLFIFLTLVAFTYLPKEHSYRRKKWLNFFIVLATTIAIFFLIMEGFNPSDRLLERFTSLPGFFYSEARIDNAISGLSMLNPLEWFIGAGLTSVIYSGPHNDYIRWVQRVGIPLMILGFMPFIIAFRICLNYLLRNRANNILPIFLAMSVGFTLFHSLFSYPREDANQAMAVYLGLAFWFGALREGLITPAITAAKLAHPPVPFSVTAQNDLTSY